MRKTYTGDFNTELLTDEILEDLPSLRGTLVDGEYYDPQLNIEAQGSAIKVTFPDEYEATIDSAVALHDPTAESYGEAYDRRAAEARENLRLLLIGPNKSVRVDDLRDLLLILNLQP